MPLLRAADAQGELCAPVSSLPLLSPYPLSRSARDADARALARRRSPAGESQSEVQTRPLATGWRWQRQSRRVGRKVL